MSIIGKNRLILNPASPHIKKVVEETVGKGNPLDAIILIGPPTEIILLACLSFPAKLDKLEVAQALSKGSLRFSSTALPVPIDSEYMLQGTIIPEYVKEGPFGDILGLYSTKDRNPLCIVEKVRYRKDPLFYSISGGTSKEHLSLAFLGLRSFFERLLRDEPSIVKYEIPKYGSGRLAILTVKGYVEQDYLLERLRKIPFLYVFIIVNEDIRMSSPSDILWALTQRTQGQQDYFFKEEKVLIDATTSDPSSLQNKRIKVFN
jgi:UbiD family decarboxylase